MLFTRLFESCLNPLPNPLGLSHLGNAAEVILQTRLLIFTESLSRLPLPGFLLLQGWDSGLSYHQLQDNPPLTNSKWKQIRLDCFILADRKTAPDNFWNPLTPKFYLFIILRAHLSTWHFSFRSCSTLFAFPITLGTVSFHFAGLAKHTPSIPLKETMMIPLLCICVHPYPSSSY